MPVAGLVDLAHAALANQADHLVRADLRAFAQSHWVRLSAVMPRLSVMPPSPIVAVTE